MEVNEKVVQEKKCRTMMHFRWISVARKKCQSKNKREKDRLTSFLLHKKVTKVYIFSHRHIFNAFRRMQKCKNNQG